MKGGTYAEALKAGFNEDQAGMLSRLGCESVNEGADLALRQLKDLNAAAKSDKERRQAILIAQLTLAIVTVVSFVVGYLAGRI